MNESSAWIQTWTSRQFFPLEPKDEDVSILDIAHALSLQCRFLGHTRSFYSVAEHSVRVANVLLPQSETLQLAGLLHDAAEAYLADVSAPVKDTLAGYQVAEGKVLSVIAQKYGLDFNVVMHGLVRQADHILLATEMRDLLGPPPAPWPSMPEPLPETIVPWTSNIAEERFLACFYQLYWLSGDQP